MSSPTPTTKELLNRLASWKPSVRQSAVEQAKQLEPDALLDLMQQGRRRLQKRSRQRWLFFCVYLVGDNIINKSMGNDAFQLSRLFFQATIWGMVFTFAPVLKTSLTAIFRDMQDAVFVPHLLTLLTSYGWMESVETQQVRTTLVNLIPRMSREQADALTSSQRQTLLLPLTHCLNAGKYGSVSADYVVTTLKALEQVGDKRELPLMEQLWAMPVLTTKDRQIQQAAAECLPYLQIRAHGQRLQTTLLRPSATATNDTGDDLLRATVPVLSAAPDEQLLRATRQE